MKLRKATTLDNQAISNLINKYAEQGLMLFKRPFQIYEEIRSFYVYEDDDSQVVGCVSMRLYWEGHAEIRSLAVDEEFKGKGLGRELVEACLREARGLFVKKVFALTYQVDFFNKMGFDTMDKSSLPQKIWSDCVHCSKFPECDETAVVIGF